MLLNSTWLTRRRISDNSNLKTTFAFINIGIIITHIQNI
jgi:hypothetical protein